MHRRRRRALSLATRRPPPPLHRNQRCAAWDAVGSEAQFHDPRERQRQGGRPRRRSEAPPRRCSSWPGRRRGKRRRRRPFAAEVPPPRGKPPPPRQAKAPPPRAKAPRAGSWRRETPGLSAARRSRRCPFSMLKKTKESQITEMHIKKTGSERRRAIKAAISYLAVFLSPDRNSFRKFLHKQI